MLPELFEVFPEMFDALPDSDDEDGKDFDFFFKSLPPAARSKYRSR